MTSRDADLTLHAAEIAVRDFSRARRGLDPDAVRSWLRTVEKAYASLEQEVRRLRDERERMTATLQAARDRAPSTSIRSTLQSAKLSKGMRGYVCEEVDELLETAAAEFARLETRTALLEHELEAVRRGGADPVARRLDEIQAQLAALQSSPLPHQPVTVEPVSLKEVS